MRKRWVRVLLRVLGGVMVFVYGGAVISALARGGYMPETIVTLAVFTLVGAGLFVLAYLGARSAGQAS